MKNQQLDSQNNTNIPTNRNRGIYILPNLFTIGSLFAGFYAIIAAMQDRYDISAFVIFIAMILDSLDGRIARMTNTSTSFGAELDSLSDMVSFGIAPALVAYYWILHYFGKFGWLAAFVYAVSVALRLARFNTQLKSNDKRYFQGLPCPASAGALMGLVWTFNEFGIHGALIGLFTLVLTVILGVFMVSNIRYRSFKDLDFKNNVPFIAILVIVLLIVLVAANKKDRPIKRSKQNVKGNTFLFASQFLVVIVIPSFNRLIILGL